MGHSRPLFHYFRLLNKVDSTDVIESFADDWIQTAYLWCQKRSLYQLSHNRCPKETKSFGELWLPSTSCLDSIWRQIFRATFWISFHCYCFYLATFAGMGDIERFKFVGDKKWEKQNCCLGNLRFCQYNGIFVNIPQYRFSAEPGFYCTLIIQYFNPFFLKTLTINSKLIKFKIHQINWWVGAYVFF